MPCFDELLYLVKLLDRWHAHECVCRRMNTNLNVVELGESNLCVLILLFFVTSSIKWLTGGGILAVGSQGGTLYVRDWGLQVYNVGYCRLYPFCGRHMDTFIHLHPGKSSGKGSSLCCDGQGGVKGLENMLVRGLHNSSVSGWMC